MLTLIGAIDDATGIVTAATFRAAEEAAGYLEVFRRTVIRHGRPLAVYSDQHGIFVKNPNRPPTLTEQLAGRRGFTQVGRALDEAGIGWIPASGPQAKGRVERLSGTKQDRLVSELRRAGATTIEQANLVLARTCLATTAASRSRPPIRSRPGGSGPTSSTSMSCSGSAIRAAWPTKRRCPGRAPAWPWHGAPMVARGPIGRSPSRSVSTEASGVGVEGQHHRLSEAPRLAPVLRARELKRIEDVVPVADPPAVTGAGPSAGTVVEHRTHPWRQYPAVRPR